jgi:hypothetical protein
MGINAGVLRPTAECAPGGATTSSASMPMDARHRDSLVLVRDSYLDLTIVDLGFVSPPSWWLHHRRRGREGRLRTRCLDTRGLLRPGTCTGIPLGDVHTWSDLHVLSPWSVTRCVYMCFRHGVRPVVSTCASPRSVTHCVVVVVGDMMIHVPMADDPHSHWVCLDIFIVAIFKVLMGDHGGLLE